jgi:hypothetical protein
MPSSYVSSHFHIVFSTKDRERIIRRNFSPNYGLTWPASPQTTACTR